MFTHQGSKFFWKLAAQNACQVLSLDVKASAHVLKLIKKKLC